jgi:hypothetical protein
MGIPGGGFEGFAPCTGGWLDADAGGNDLGVGICAGTAAPAGAGTESDPEGASLRRFFGGA